MKTYNMAWHVIGYNRPSFDDIDWLMQKLTRTSLSVKTLHFLKTQLRRMSKTKIKIPALLQLPGCTNLKISMVFIDSCFPNTGKLLKMVVD